MFCEYLEKHPLAGLLPDTIPSLWPPIGSPEWRRLAPEHIQEIDRQAALYKDKPYPLRLMSGFLAFVRSGSRQADEQPYFFRRRKLCWAALYAAIHDDAPLDDVIDGLYLICEESTWVISAHNVNPIPGAPEPRDLPLPDTDRPYIDLFAAQTGMILSIVTTLLRARLDAVSPLIVRRVSGELEARILTPFMTHDEYWWMGVTRTDLNNWTPWIISNVMVAACQAPIGRDALAKLLTRALTMLDRYIAILPADGGLDEGAGYWNMAGGSLCDCLDTLEKVTGGQMTFWQDEKLRNILTFPLRAQIGGGYFINYADCDARPFLSGERLQYAGERLGDPALAQMGVSLRGTLTMQLDDVPHLTRLMDLLFHAPRAGQAAEPPGDVFLPDLQLRLVRRGALTAVIKGGHNGENHNHNDVGSFMLYMDNAPILVDAGNMVYTAKTFSSERYTLWNTRSAYHSVPIVNGTEQAAGEGYKAGDVRRTENGMTLDIAGAYPGSAGVLSLTRALALSDGALTVRDAVRLVSPGTITWVFMLRDRPTISGSRVLLPNFTLSLPEGTDAQTEEIPVTDPRMARSFPSSLYRLMLTPPGADVYDITWTFRRNTQNEL